MIVDDVVLARALSWWQSSTHGDQRTQLAWRLTGEEASLSFEMR